MFFVSIALKADAITTCVQIGLLRLVSVICLILRKKQRIASFEDDDLVKADWASSGSESCVPE